MHDRLGVGVLGILGLIAIATVLGKNAPVVHDVFSGGTGLLSVAMGGAAPAGG